MTLKVGDVIHSHNKDSEVVYNLVEIFNKLKEEQYGA